MTTVTKPNVKTTMYSRLEGGDYWGWTYTPISQTRDFEHSRNGIENPKWREQVAVGENACTPMTAVRRDMVFVPGDYSVTRNYPWWGGHPWTETVQGDVYGYRASIMTCDEANFDVTTADNLAKAKFLKEVKATQQKIAGGVVLGELKETLRMIRSPAKALFESFKTYRDAILWNKRISKRNVKKYIEGVRQSWLEFQFGAKPLVHDIRDGAAAYADLMEGLEERPPWDEVKGVGKWKDIYIDAIDQADSFGLPVLHCKTSTRRAREAVVVYRGKVMSEYSCAPSSTARRIVTSLGLGPEEWLPTAWELIPFSFVLDYFTNIGDILSSITTSRSSIMYINRTSILTENEFIRGTPDLTKVHELYDPYVTTSGSSLGYALSYTTRISRAPIWDFNLYPTLVIKHPPFDSLKWLNLAALVGGFRAIRP